MNIYCNTGFNFNNYFIHYLIVLFLENQAFKFFVRATDGGTSALYRDVPVFIHIMGKHEFTPLFHKENEEFFIPENAKPGKLIVSVLFCVLTFLFDFIRQICFYSFLKTNKYLL